MAEKKNIALLYGGFSSEREISFKSGKNVGNALEKLGHKVTYIDTKEKNNLKTLFNDKYDYAFICLHGKGGEDGSIQGLLEVLHIPYSGPNVAASALAMSKARTKELYVNNNIPTPKYFLIRKDFDYDLKELLKITGEHVVVKAVKEGSSIGLYTVDGKENIQDAINKALTFDVEAIVEKYIRGREFTVSVMEFPKTAQKKYSEKLNFENNIAALPVIEIIPKNEFYDFDSKYDEGGSEHICPAKIDNTLTKNLQKYAVDAYKVLKCKGFCRTDFLVDDLNNIYALETNTIPGMTNKSLFPDAAKAVGINFEELCSLIVSNQ